MYNSSPAMLQNGQASENLDDIDSEFAEILDRTDHAEEDKRSVCRKFEAASHDRYVFDHAIVHDLLPLC